MPKHLWLVLTLFLISVGVAALSASAPIATAEPVQSEPFRAGTTDGWPPYEFYDPSRQRMTGYSTEVIRQVLARMDRSLATIEVLPWVRAQNMLFSGDLDILYSATPSPNRLKLGLHPQEPLATSYWVLFTLKSNPIEFTDLDDLKDLKIGTVKGYTYTPEFWQAVRQTASTTPVITDEQNFKMLMQRRVDLVAAELANGLEICHQLGIEQKVIPITKHPIRVTTLHPFFSRKTVDAQTAQRFSEELAEFKQTDEYRQLYRRFFHRLESYLPSSDL